ncbi:nuclear transport factor 2 family protein [Anaeromyxobacter oryzae]|uniref:DUF4440 domain-containing protein n=1 Tax=Anaeromyxobacter oryzae TaxID=2918170 RepID=A0ABM7WNT9_9BACT|nr:nuclear transport factor 2 family protein [Anaeromyxobacter oryzae]BDG01128.1 hypothetical protein AMOR_01240 [Anaeromyxobacter oryzae]
MELTRRLVDLEDRFWASAGDPEFYRRALAANAVMVFPHPARVLDRDGAIGAVATTKPWTSWALEDRRAVRLSESTAVLTYRALARREGQAPYAALVTSVYVEEDGAWKLAVHQQTPVPAP